MSRPTKGDRNLEIIELLQAGSTTKEAAENFGISYQRVCQIARYYKIDLKQRKTKRQALIDGVSDLIGTMPDTKLAREFGVAVYVVSYARKKLDIERYFSVEVIGCANCKTKPYVKGLCRRCYDAKQRRDARVYR